MSSSHILLLVTHSICWHCLMCSIMCSCVSHPMHPPDWPELPVSFFYTVILSHNDHQHFCLLLCKKGQGLINVARQQGYNPGRRSKVSSSTHWWKITKYLNTSTVLKPSLEVLVRYLSISILCYFMLLLNYILEANTVLFTLFHLSDNFSCFADSNYEFKI